MYAEAKQNENDNGYVYSLHSPGLIQPGLIRLSLDRSSGQLPNQPRFHAVRGQIGQNTQIPVIGAIPKKGSGKDDVKKWKIIVSGRPRPDMRRHPNTIP